MKGVWNHIRAIDVLETLDEVDKSRIGCIGNSLGGYNALFLAAFEPRIQVVVCSGGYSTFADYARHLSDGSTLPGKGSLSAWGIPKHMPRITSHCDDDPEKVPFDFTEILGALRAPAPLYKCPHQRRVLPLLAFRLNESRSFSVAGRFAPIRKVCVSCFGGLSPGLGALKPPFSRRDSVEPAFEGVL